MSSTNKIVLLCGDAPNQVALANKIQQQFNLAAVIVERKRKPSFTLKKLSRKIIDKLFFSEIDHAWFNMLSYYKNHFKSFNAPEIIYVESINEPRIKNFLSVTNPDLVIVSGTSIIKKELLELKPRIGILNLHTGLSPYVKGGPNCTNWCIANNQMHLIGNTIMWIDAGIDSGNLIATSQVDFDGSENLSDVHIKVMNHAHNLYLDVLKIAERDASKLNNIRQVEVGDGKTYYNSMWNFSAKKNLLRNFGNSNWEKTIKSEIYLEKKASVKTVSVVS